MATTDMHCTHHMVRGEHVCAICFSTRKTQLRDSQVMGWSGVSIRFSNSQIQMNDSCKNEYYFHLQYLKLFQCCGLLLLNFGNNLIFREWFLSFLTIHWVDIDICFKWYLSVTYLKLLLFSDILPFAHNCKNEREK